MTPEVYIVKYQTNGKKLKRNVCYPSTRITIDSLLSNTKYKVSITTKRRTQQEGKSIFSDKSRTKSAITGMFFI